MNRFCKDYGIDKDQRKHLCGLVDFAYEKQVEYHNNDVPGTDIIADKAVQAVEDYAKSIGIEGITWEGLYPTFHKGNNHRNLD